MQYNETGIVTPIPKTRQSLLIRLQSEDNEAAWSEFVSIYRPVIVRTAVSMGLQPVDGEDLAQQVLMRVSKQIPLWENDPQRARFRTWLNKIVHNAAINALTRRRMDRGIGGTEAMLAMNREAERDKSREVLEFQWRQEAFRWAADQIRDESRNIGTPKK